MSSISPENEQINKRVKKKKKMFLGATGISLVIQMYVSKHYPLSNHVKHLRGTVV